MRKAEGGGETPRPHSFPLAGRPVQFTLKLALALALLPPLVASARNA